MIETLPGVGKTLVIEASAGTGKTWAISTLAARYIAEQQVPISRLAIVTFSVASAGEVRARTRSRLAEAARWLEADTAPQEADEDLRRLWSTNPSVRTARRGRLLTALNDFSQASIMTTHSFCDRLLACLGILADHDPTDRLVTDLSELTVEVTSDYYLAERRTNRLGFSFSQALAWVHKAQFAPTAPIEPAGSPEAEFVRAVQALIERAKRRQGIYTFDDMLVRCRDGLNHPETGAAARARVAEAYPILLVDEFQDTDPIQWEIIRSGFVGTSSVVLIGDPKQSIYGFRGTDVEAYLQATKQADEVVRLDTNHRSAPDLVDAVANLVGGAKLGDDRIAVHPVLTSENTPRLICADGQPWRQPLRIRIPSDLTPLAVATARELIDSDLITDLTALLAGGLLYQTKALTRPLAAQDIAIIVSTNGRGNELLERLRLSNIPAIFTGAGSVFETSAAADWLSLLRALDDSSASKIRAASITSLIGWDINRLVSASSTEFARLAGQIRHLADLRTNALGVLEWLIDRTDLVARLQITEADGEAQLADLTQLAYLLSTEPVGLTSPLDWLIAQRAAGTNPDESTRRSTTRRNAVRILTVHQAKGLQFPVVYLPQLADRHLRKAVDQPTISHDGQGNRVVELGIGIPVGNPSQEEAAESLRAGYVALTRATTHITTWWVPTTQNTHASPLHRFMFRESPAPAETISLTGRDPKNLNLPKIAIETIGAQPTTPLTRPTEPPPADGPAVDAPGPRRPLTRPIDHTWRRASFSSLTAQAHQTRSDENPLPLLTPEADARLDQLSPMADLPSGIAFGSLIHAIFEYADPVEDLTALISDTINPLEWPDLTAETLAQALQPGLNTPLGPLASNRTLAEIPLGDRVAEMDFELALATDGEASDLSLIAEVFARHLPPDDPLADYPAFLAQAELDSRALRGFLVGSIDAVLRVDDRYLVVDYKTNHLGVSDRPLRLADYTSAAMARAMISSHYPLQAILYAIALHRFLRWRLADYDPERHLGGILYLFVRGMAGPDTPVVDGTPCGVFTWRPPVALVMELSDRLAGVVR
ncbi:MAG: UvrD-helicase domain-containing protein [Propionibacteriaceae bacterium]|jgi:exodeoxyribonuclease V beta subunit|nr:UvrD-helicase domain-containing protein [Propionibacteriaceae bacterium]